MTPSLIANSPDSLKELRLWNVHDPSNLPGVLNSFFEHLRRIHRLEIRIKRTVYRDSNLQYGNWLNKIDAHTKMISQKNFDGDGPPADLSTVIFVWEADEGKYLESCQLGTVLLQEGIRILIPRTGYILLPSLLVRRRTLSHRKVRLWKYAFIKYKCNLKVSRT